MKNGLMSVLVAVGLLASVQVSADMSGDVKAGEAKAASCIGCHGDGGNSTAPSFPKLAGQGQKYLIKQINDIKSGARAVVEMTGILDGLSEQDIKNIAAYYSAQTITIGQAKKELVELGQKLYRTGNPATSVAACTACHGPTGTGIELAGFPAVGGQHAGYIDAQLKKFRTGERTNDGDARIMRAIAARLSDREIEALASYISGLHK